MNDPDRGAAKFSGRQKANEWCETATTEQQVGVAGSDFEYGETLDDLIAEHFTVPRSDDPDFSWGFFKLVKSRVFHAMEKLKRGNKGPRDA